MTIKDKIILGFFEEYISTNSRVQKLVDADISDENGIYPLPNKVKESEILFNSIGEMFKKYAEAFLKGADINGNEEITQDNNLTDLIIKLATKE